MELQSGHAEKAAELASNGGNEARASELAPYLRSVISDSELLESLARLRGGDAASACPILTRALATRVDLYVPKSPKIAEAQLALAECEFALGHRSDAAGLVAAAAAIEAQHSAHSSHYQEPLRKLRARLEGNPRSH